MLGLKNRIHENLIGIWADPTAITTPIFLRTILRDAIIYASNLTDAAAKRLAGNSHSHDNGFTKLVLYDSDDGRFRVRLHTWNPAAEQDVNIHDHRYDFVSLVVTGMIENKRWDFCETGTEYKLFRYVPRDENGAYRLELVDRHCLTARATETYFAGDSYLMRRDELHTARTTAGVKSITMCVQDRHKLKPEARTLSLSHPDEKWVMSSPGLDLDDYRLAVGDLYELELSPALQEPA